MTEPTKPNPTIGEVRNARDKAEINIASEIENFMLYTGISVTGINVVTEQGLFGTAVIVKVKLQTEL